MSSYEQKISDAHQNATNYLITEISEHNLMLYKGRITFRKSHVYLEKVIII